MREMVDIATFNCRVQFDRGDVPFKERKILGDATDTGLTRFVEQALPSNYDEYVKRYPKVFELPFNSTNKWALVIVRKFPCLSTVSSLGSLNSS